MAKIIKSKQTMLNSQQYEHFLPELITVLQNICKLSNQIRFERAGGETEESLKTVQRNKQPLILSVFGEIGAGKSSLLNNIMRTYCETFKYKYDSEKLPFKKGCQSFAVTTDAKIISKGPLRLIDTPGSNDPIR